MTFDSAPALALDNDGNLIPFPAPVTAPAPAPKRGKAKAGKATPPAPSLFADVLASCAIRGNFGLYVDRDTDDGLTLTVSTLETTMRVDYTGPHDRTLVPTLREKQREAGNGLCESFTEFTSALVPAGAVTMPATQVREALEFVTLAMSPDETRYNLCGVYLDGAAWVATDGHRLHMIEGMASPTSRGVIVPAHAAKALLRSIKVTKAETVTLSSVDCAPYLLAHMSGPHMSVEIRVRLVDGQFPCYQNVIPSESSGARYTGDADALRRSIDSAPLIGDKGTARRFVFSDDGAVTTQRHDRMAVSLPLSSDMPQACEVALNTRYFDQALSEMDGRITLSLVDDMSPVRIDNALRTVVIMPMRK